MVTLMFREMEYNPNNSVGPTDPRAIYMWGIGEVGSNWITGSGMRYEEVQPLLAHFGVSEPRKLVGKTFDAPDSHSDPGSALDLLLKTIKNGGAYVPPTDEALYERAVAGLACMACPDFSDVDGQTVARAFGRVFQGFAPRPGWFAQFQQEVTSRSAGAVSVEQADPQVFRMRVKGPAAYLSLVRGSERRRLIFGPYSTPFVFDEAVPAAGGAVTPAAPPPSVPAPALIAGGVSTGATGRLTGSVLLHGRYRIDRLIGQGGMGAVYQGEDTHFSRLVAIKEMSQSGLSGAELAEAVEGFKREARLLAGLMHPHLPRIYEQFEEGERWYLVMDYIEGQTLEQYLQGTAPQLLPLGEALELGIQLCAVLDYLHSRQPPVIFRDLKPANVMRSPGGHLYLIDFGIARHFKPGQARDTQAMGSPGYAAPEQFGRQQTEARSDLYSLGAVLHQLLSGSDPAQNSPSPFHFSSLLGATPGLPPELDALVLRLVHLDLSQRPGSAAEVKAALKAIALSV